MPSVLRSPRWLFGHVLVVAICITFVNLGFWQIQRLEDRRLQNTVTASRLTAAPLPVDVLVAGAGTEIDSLEFRNATAVGTFDRDEEVLLRSQVHDGIAGWHVITPLVLEDGRAILVDRGWVPLEMDSVPVAAVPPSGPVSVTGWVSLTRLRRSGGPVEPAGPLTDIARVDLDRLQEQMPFELLPVYMVADDAGETLPIAAARPVTNDEGPHLMYAIEWFSFTLIGAVGYVFLLRRAVRNSDVGVGSGGLGQAHDDRDIADRPQ